MSQTILYLSVPLEHGFAFITARSHTICTKYGGRMSDTGFGFGMRDMDFVFEGDVPQEAIDELKKDFPDMTFDTGSRDEEAA